MPAPLAKPPEVWLGSRSCCANRTSPWPCTSERCEYAARRRDRRPRRPVEAERRKHLQPSDLRRSHRHRLAGDPARRPRVLAMARSRVRAGAGPVARRHRGRRRLAVLVHISLGEAPPSYSVAHAQMREAAVLCAAQYVITTSWSTRERLLRRYALPPDKVHVAQPGVDPARLASGTDRGGELLCVAPVSSHKGHDVLLAALAATADLPWRCVCVGSLDRDPVFVERLRLEAEVAGVGDRIRFPGVQIGDDLAHAYAAADVLVLASRAETYGMVVTEALARGLPVIATAVGGLPEALGQASDGRRPGLLVPPEDSVALAAALRDWLVEANLRHRLREAARERRSTLSGWDAPTDRIARVLAQATTS